MADRDALPPVFVLGGGPTTLGLLRSLGRRGIATSVFTTHRDDIVSRSRFARTVPLTRPDDAQEVVDQIASEALALSQKPVLFVTGDRNLISACRYADRLSESFHVVLPGQRAAETVVDKELFRAFAEKHGAPVPQSWTPSTTAELESLLDDLRFPLVLKPTHSADWRQDHVVAEQGWIKIIRVDDAQALLSEWTRISLLCGPPVVQEFIPGDDSSHFSFVSYRDRQGRELTAFCARKLRLDPIHGGFGVCATLVREPAMEAAGRRVLELLDYRGPTSVCFKRNPETAEARIFEINGRLPLVHSISQLGGIDLPWLMYRDALGLPCETRAPKPSRGYWLLLEHDISAAMAYRREGELTFLGWLLSLLKVRLVVEFDRRDPGPFLHVLGRCVRKLFRKAWRPLRP